jgi:uncharacterized protein YjiS (DUF1127 family)
MGTISLTRRIVRPFGRIGSFCIETLLEVWSLDRERRVLQSLDGLTRADVEGELAKPFWRR